MHLVYIYLRKLLERKWRLTATTAIGVVIFWIASRPSLARRSLRWSGSGFTIGNLQHMHQVMPPREREREKVRDQNYPCPVLNHSTFLREQFKRHHFPCCKRQKRSTGYIYIYIYSATLSRDFFFLFLLFLFSVLMNEEGSCMSWSTSTLRHRKAQLCMAFMSTWKKRMWCFKKKNDQKEFFSYTWPKTHRWVDQHPTLGTEKLSSALLCMDFVFSYMHSGRQNHIEEENVTVQEKERLEEGSELALISSLWLMYGIDQRTTTSWTRSDLRRMSWTKEKMQLTLGGNHLTWRRRKKKQWLWRSPLRNTTVLSKKRPSSLSHSLPQPAADQSGEPTSMTSRREKLIYLNCSIITFLVGFSSTCPIDWESKKVSGGKIKKILIALSFFLKKNYVFFFHFPFFCSDITFVFI